MSHTRFEGMQRGKQTRVASTANVFEDNTSNEDLCLKEHMPLVKCECGAEILLLPDLKAMNHAIEAHVGEHRKKGKNAPKAPTSSRVRQLLVQLTLVKASESTRH